MRWPRKVGIGILCLAGVLVLAGFGNSIHRAADTMAILRPVFGTFCLVGVFVAKLGWLRLLFAVTAVLGLVTVGRHFTPQKTG